MVGSSAPDIHLNSLLRQEKLEKGEIKEQDKTARNRDI